MPSTYTPTLLKLVISVLHAKYSRYIPETDCVRYAVSEPIPRSFTRSGADVYVTRHHEVVMNSRDEWETQQTGLCTIRAWVQTLDTRAI